MAGFDIKTALKSVVGKTWVPEELYRQFKRIRGEHYRELPIEFDVDDLFSMAQRLELIKVEPNGYITVLAEPRPKPKPNFRTQAAEFCVRVIEASVRAAFNEIGMGGGMDMRLEKEIDAIVDELKLRCMP